MHHDAYKVCLNILKVYVGKLIRDAIAYSVANNRNVIKAKLSTVTAKDEKLGSLNSKIISKENNSITQEEIKRKRCEMWS